MQWHETTAGPLDEYMHDTPEEGALAVAKEYLSNLYAGMSFPKT